MNANQAIDRLLAGKYKYVAAPPRIVVQGDFRPRILLPGRGGRLIDDFAADLAKEMRDKPIFNYGGIVVVLETRTTNRTRLSEISAASFRSWIEKHNCGGVVCQGWVGRGDESRVEDQSLSEEGARATLASPRFIEGLREISRVNFVRQPVMRKRGDTQTVELLEPGYDKETKIFTIDTIEYDEELPIEDAIAFFDKWHADTAFNPEDKLRSLSVATAMQFGVYCDCMFNRFVVRPAFIVAANTEGAGKTMLVMMAVAPVFGPTKLTPPPSKEGDKITELLNSIAQSGTQYVVFDNWRGKIEHAALEAFITANTWSGRRLGTSNMFESDKQCLVFITSNDAFVGGDMRRRALFIDLFVSEARAEDRHIGHPINEGDILDARAGFLAAMWAYVRTWRENGMKLGSTRHSSFDEWGKVIGGILEEMSYPSPLLPPPSRIDPRFDSFTRIIASVASEMKEAEEFMRPGELLEKARAVGAFPWIINDTTDPTTLSDKELRSERSGFSKQCEHFKGRTFTLPLDAATLLSVSFDSIGLGHQKQYRFRRALIDKV